jgi:ribosome recycling factor
MTTADIRKTAEQKMTRSIEAFKNELQKIRTGRAHPGILDQVHIDYYGSMVPISQVANVSLLDARTISVQPWEKGMGAKIEKAIASPISASIRRRKATCFACRCRR